MTIVLMAVKYIYTLTMSQEEEEAAAIRYHPMSRWEEPLTETNLTMYDLHRRPRVLIEDDNHRLAIPLKTLNVEFVCPICLHYMTKTTIVMECLHRFCGECIQKCLRIGKKECPSCRTHIPSRRSLRADPAFDKLLRHILGDIDALEARELEQAKLVREKFKAMAESRKRGILLQTLRRNKKQALTSGSITDITEIEAEAEADVEVEVDAGIDIENDSEIDHPSQSDESNHMLQEDTQEVKPGLKTEKWLRVKYSPLVDFVLQRHPQEMELDRLKREWIRLNEAATVSVLQKFLSQKLSNKKQRYSPNEIEVRPTNERSIRKCCAVLCCAVLCSH